MITTHNVHPVDHHNTSATFNSKTLSLDDFIVFMNQNTHRFEYIESIYDESNSDVTYINNKLKNYTNGAAAKQLLQLLLNYKKNHPGGTLIVAYSQITAESGDTSLILQKLLNAVGIYAAIIEPHRDDKNHQLRDKELKQIKDHKSDYTLTPEGKIDCHNNGITVFVTGHHEQGSAKICGPYGNPTAIGREKEEKCTAGIKWPITSVVDYLSSITAKINDIQLCICYGSEEIVRATFQDKFPDATIHAIPTPFKRPSSTISLTQLVDLLCENIKIFSAPIKAQTLAPPVDETSMNSEPSYNNEPRKTTPSIPAPTSKHPKLTKKNMAAACTLFAATAGGGTLGYYASTSTIVNALIPGVSHSLFLTACCTAGCALLLALMTYGCMQLYDTYSSRQLAYRK